MDTRGNSFGILSNYTYFKNLEESTTSKNNISIDRHECLNEASKDNEISDINNTLFQVKDLESIKDKIADLQQQLTRMQLAIIEQYEENLILKNKIMKMYQNISLATMIETSTMERAAIYADLIRKGIKNLNDIPDNKEIKDVVNNLLKQD